MLVERTMRYGDGYVHRKILKLPTFSFVDGPTVRIRQLGYRMDDEVRIEYRRIASRVVSSLFPGYAASPYLSPLDPTGSHQRGATHRYQSA
jgi:hypothetical protein